MSKIKLPHASGNSMSIGAPATNPASDLELKLPATIGSANQLLKNSGTAGTLEYSSNLTYDGSKLVVGNSGTAYGSAATQSFVAHTANAGSSGLNSIDTTAVAAGVGGEVAFAGKYNTGAQDYAYTGHIRGIKENATAGNTACALTFHTRPTATAPQERLRIKSDGHVSITSGNLEFASGAGIDFSNVSDGSRSISTDGNKFDDYEEGAWTPTGNGFPTISNESGKYVKIGNVVHAWWQMEFASDGSSSHAHITNLPFTSANNGPYGGGTAWDYRTSSTLNVHVSGGSTLLYFYHDDGSTCLGNHTKIEGKQFRACTTYRVS